MTKSEVKIGNRLQRRNENWSTESRRLLFLEFYFTRISWNSRTEIVFQNGYKFLEKCGDVSERIAKFWDVLAAQNHRKELRKISFKSDDDVGEQIAKFWDVLAPRISDRNRTEIAFRNGYKLVTKCSDVDERVAKFRNRLAIRSDWDSRFQNE